MMIFASFVCMLFKVTDILRPFYLPYIICIGILFLLHSRQFLFSLILLYVFFSRSIYICTNSFLLGCGDDDVGGDGVATATATAIVFDKLSKETG